VRSPANELSLLRLFGNRRLLFLLFRFRTELDNGLENIDIGRSIDAVEQSVRLKTDLDGLVSGTRHDREHNDWPVAFLIHASFHAHCSINAFVQMRKTLIWLPRDVEVRFLSFECVQKNTQDRVACV
jgi:hypothetical protein